MVVQGGAEPVRGGHLHADRAGPEPPARADRRLPAAGTAAPACSTSRSAPGHRHRGPHVLRPRGRLRGHAGQLLRRARRAARPAGAAGRRAPRPRRPGRQRPLGPDVPDLHAVHARPADALPRADRAPRRADLRHQQHQGAVRGEGTRARPVRRVLRARPRHRRRVRRFHGGAPRDATLPVDRRGARAPAHRRRGRRRTPSTAGT